MPFFELKDGFKVAYEEHGPKDGPAVIFLHSFLMNRAMFSPQVDKLKSTYRCILVDERGHGETRAGPNEAKSFTFWDTANDVLALSHGLGLKLISIVGISQGGFVAMRCAMLEPDFVKSIAVMGTSADAESEENKVAFGGIWKAWDENGLDAILDTIMFVSLAGDKGVFKGDAEMTATIRARMLQRNSADDEAIFMALLNRDSIYERLGEIKCPTIVLHGTDDHSYAPEKGERIRDALAKDVMKGWVLVPGGAHFLSITDPEAVDGPLTNFLDTYAK